MESNHGKLNIKIGEMEISIEGPSDFVSNQYDKIQENLNSYREISKSLESNTTTKEISQENKGNESIVVDTEFEETPSHPATFGEWLNIIPKNTSETDKALLAGYFTQLQSDNKAYRSRDVSKILKEHGVNLSNPSRFVKLNADNKRAFQVNKTGTETNYRLSRDGEAYAKKMLGIKE